MLMDYGGSGGVPSSVHKYWRRRHTLFSKYDDGIVMDEEGWYSVTPELIARRQAERCARAESVVIDAFCGMGGNAIQFALRCRLGQVIAIDKDPIKIACARHNARVYGVEDRIQFITGDFFELAPNLKGDVVFLAPPWGGLKYVRDQDYNLDMLQPENGFKLFDVAKRVAPKVVLYLPRNVNVSQLKELSHRSNPPTRYEVEQNFDDRERLIAVTVYYGEFDHSLSWRTNTRTEGSAAAVYHGEFDHSLSWRKNTRTEGSAAAVYYGEFDHSLSWRKNTRTEDSGGSWRQTKMEDRRALALTPQDKMFHRHPAFMTSHRRTWSPKPMQVRVTG